MTESSGGNKRFSTADHIRFRLGMYLGDTGSAGLHRLVYELIEYSLAAFAVGQCNCITVRINVDGSLTVADDGPGISIVTAPGTEMTTLEWVMTLSNGVEIHQGQRRFRNTSHGVGACTVTALSDWSEAIVSWDGRLYRQKYERGIPAGDVCDIGPAQGRSGTSITFHPDSEILCNTTFNRERLADRLRELAFLEKGLTTQVSDEQVRREETLHYPRGIVDFVEYLNRDEEVLHKPFHVERKMDDVQVGIAVQFTTGAKEQIRCYANNAHNAEGGTHRRGFQMALARRLERYCRDENLPIISRATSDEGICEGLTAIVHVRLADPQFESQSKLRLHNPEVEAVVADVVEKEFGRFLKENPEAARRIIITAAKHSNQC